MRGSSMTLVALALALLAGPGCEDKSSEPQFKPESVPEDKPIDELDPMEQAEFCEEATEWARDFLDDKLPRLLCRVDAIEAGVTDAGTFDVDACRAAEQECLANPPTDDIDTNNLTCDFDNLGPSCDVTVGEYADCFEEAAKLADRFVSATTCDRIASGNIPDESEFQLSASCQSLLERCGSSTSSGESTGASDSSGSETGGPSTG